MYITAQSQDARPQKPQNWEQAIVLALYKNDPGIIQAYTKTQPEHSAPTYAMPSAPLGLHYGKCGDKKYGANASDLCNQDPAIYKSELTDRGAIFRQAANDLGLDVSDITSLKRLHDFDSEAGLSDYELGMALEDMSMMYVCGAPSSDALHPYNVKTWIKNNNADEGYVRRTHRNITAMHEHATPDDTFVEVEPLTTIETLNLFGRDGQVTKLEWDNHWPQFDENGNRRLDTKEDMGPKIYYYINGMGGPNFSKNIAKAAEQRFAYIDVNDDDIITAQEFTDAAQLRSDAYNVLVAERDAAFQDEISNPKSSYYKDLNDELDDRRREHVQEAKDKFKKYGYDWTWGEQYAKYYKKHENDKLKDWLVHQEHYRYQQFPHHKDEKAKADFNAYIKGEGKAEFDQALADKKFETVDYACTEIWDMKYSSSLLMQFEDEFQEDNPIPIFKGSGKDARANDKVIIERAKANASEN